MNNMNDLEILQSIADANKIEVSPSPGNLGMFKVTLNINGARIQGQFDVMNVGVYALEIGDVANLRQMVGTLIKTT